MNLGHREVRVVASHAAGSSQEGWEAARLMGLEVDSAAPVHLPSHGCLTARSCARAGPPFPSGSAKAKQR